MAAIKQTFDEWKGKLETCLQEKNCVTNQLAKLEQMTGVKRLNIVFAFMALVGLYLMVGYGADFLCNFIGFLYPAYASIKAIESMEKDDDTKWLTYWVVYSVFHLAEFFGDIFLFWVPFYWFFKCIFMIYCMFPIPSNGSCVIYRRFIRPYILKYEDKIDSGFAKAEEAARRLAKEAEALGMDALKKHVQDGKLE
jgi:receptor expression-enhancing protein 5/6